MKIATGNIPKDTNPKDSTPSKPEAYPKVIEEQVEELLNDLIGTTHTRADVRKTKQALQKAFTAGLMQEAEHSPMDIYEMPEDIPENMKQRISFLRQWLNEDRITDVDRMVSNKQLWNWLKD